MFIMTRVAVDLNTTVTRYNTTLPPDIPQHFANYTLNRDLTLHSVDLTPHIVGRTSHILDITPYIVDLTPQIIALNTTVDLTT